MARERASNCSSISSRDGEVCSSSSDTTSSSSSSSSLSSHSSSSVSGADARPSSHKRRRSRSQSLKHNQSSRRELTRKHRKERHINCKSGTLGKKRRKHYYGAEPDEKSDLKRHRKRSKKRKLEKQFENAKKISLAEKKRTHKLCDSPDDLNSKEKTNNLLEVAMNAQEQQKALIRRNAELAKARLASGELQRAREEQKKMHQLYGTVDWRANKKLRTEKKILERTVAAGKKLASLEEREYARMDAFRIADYRQQRHSDRLNGEWKQHKHCSN